MINSLETQEYKYGAIEARRFNRSLDLNFANFRIRTRTLRYTGNLAHLGKGRLIL